MCQACPCFPSLLDRERMARACFFRGVVQGPPKTARASPWHRALRGTGSDSRPGAFPLRLEELHEDHGLDSGGDVLSVKAVGRHGCRGLRRTRHRGADGASLVPYFRALTPVTQDSAAPKKPAHKFTIRRRRDAGEKAPWISSAIHCVLGGKFCDPFSNRTGRRPGVSPHSAFPLPRVPSPSRRPRCIIAVTGRNKMAEAA